MKIYAPVKDISGVRASVRFVNGVGETDDPYLLEWFISHGYRIESIGKIQSEILDEIIADSNEPDFDSMTPNELREWAKVNGFGGQIKNIRNKEKLLEIIRG